MGRIGKDAGVALGILLASVALQRLRPFGETDWWWHVSAGRTVLAHGSRVIPETTAFHGPTTYVDPEWGFDVLSVGLMAAGGTTAAVAFTIVCAVAATALVWLGAREAGSDDRGATALTALALGASVWHFTPRPQSLQMVLTPLAIWLGLRVANRTGAARTGAIVALHVVLAAWSQLHTSIVVAPVIAWLACLPRSWDAPRPGPAAIVALAALAIWPFTGPFGLHVVDQVLRHADAADTTRYIFDMEPGSLARLVRLAEPGAPGLLLLLGVAAVSTARSRRLAPGPLLLTLLGLALMLTARRFMAVWAVLSVPLAATAGAGRRTPSWGLLAVSILPTMLWVDRGAIGLGEDHEAVPFDLGDALAARGTEGRIFGEYADGGYLGWRFAPELRIFIDGRTPVHFDADDLYAYRRGVRDAAFLQRLDEAFGFDAIAFRRDRPACAALAAGGRFTPVWADRWRVLFVKGGGEAVAEPCLPPVDLTPRPEPGGAERADAWAAALAAGRADEVRREAEDLLRGLGHEAAPIVRLRLAEACAATGDAACVGSQAWRAALEGVPGATELLRAHRDALTGAPRERADAWLAAVSAADAGTPAAP